MLKAMIIDDEDYIREGLKKIINWNGHGFYICGEASNGLRGLTQIRELNPDLVIVDVKMPIMDGLEMIKNLRKENIFCEFIVLSAYSDFKYAQSAIELGVDSYILKPIDQNVLIEKVCKAHDKIINNKLIKDNIDLSISFSKDKILQSIIFNTIDVNTFEKYYSFFGFDFPWSNYRIALVEIEGENLNEITAKMNVKSNIESIISENELGYVFDIEIYVGILFNEIKLKANLKILQQMPLHIKELCGADITIVLGSLAENISDISSSFHHACKLINRKFILGSKGIISDSIEESNIAGEGGNIPVRYSMEHIADSLYKAIDAGNISQIENAMDIVYQEFLCEKYCEDVIKVNYSNIYSAALNKLVLVNCDMKEKLSVCQEVLKEICQKDSLQELHVYMKHKFIEISEELQKMRPDDPFKKIIDYIGRNYNQDLKLETIAALFNYNSDYLGKKIRQNTGKHFNTYLDTIRVEKAIHFLREGYKVYQVAQKTGFKDMNYFYKKFKFYVGVSPSDFKGRT
ncbi:response regulator transcription factor [Ruminiclostridium herbifermentans]|nr:response regulator [Ruminiclostridium herbifermentans]